MLGGEPQTTHKEIPPRDDFHLAEEVRRRRVDKVLVLKKRLCQKEATSSDEEKASPNCVRVHREGAVGEEMPGKRAGEIRWASLAVQALIGLTV